MIWQTWRWETLATLNNEYASLTGSQLVPGDLAECTHALTAPSIITVVTHTAQNQRLWTAGWTRFVIVQWMLNKLFTFQKLNIYIKDESKETRHSGVSGGSSAGAGALSPVWYREVKSIFDETLELLRFQIWRGSELEMEQGWWAHIR